MKNNKEVADAPGSNLHHIVSFGDVIAILPANNPTQDQRLKRHISRCLEEKA